MEATMDTDFLKSFLGESAKAMREIMQGKEFWYLVSLEGRRERRRRRSRAHHPFLLLSVVLSFVVSSICSPRTGNALHRPCVSRTWNRFSSAELWDFPSSCLENSTRVRSSPLSHPFILSTMARRHLPPFFRGKTFIAPRVSRSCERWKSTTRTRREEAEASGQRGR